MHQLRTPIRADLIRRGFSLEYATLAWNVIGVFVLATAAIAAHSVALAGFGLDSLVEIGASLVVIWELQDVAAARRDRALRFIGLAFVVLATYIALQSIELLTTQVRPHPSELGILWTALTVVAMAALAAGKARTGRLLNNTVLLTEGRVTLIDALLAAAVLVGLILTATLGWWWADPLAGLVIVFYGYLEGWKALRS